MQTREKPKYSLIGIYCDETGTSGLPCYGFGSLWIPWERRGDLAALVRDVKSRGFDQELKWSGIKKRSLPMYRELVEEFFKRPWMVFHCLIVRRSDVKRDNHRDMEEAMRKHYTLLLGDKIHRYASRRSDRRFRIRVDNLPFGYSKADEVMEIVLNHLGRKLRGQGAVTDLRPVDSKKTAGVQLCDVLLGAVASAWQETPLNGPKTEIRQLVADHLGWDDLRADTWKGETKFNIWVFFDPSRGIARRVRGRRVILKYPIKRFQPPGRGRV